MISKQGEPVGENIQQGEPVGEFIKQDLKPDLEQDPKPDLKPIIKQGEPVEVISKQGEPVGEIIQQGEPAREIIEQGGPVENTVGRKAAAVEDAEDNPARADLGPDAVPQCSQDGEAVAREAQPGPVGDTVMNTVMGMVEDSAGIVSNTEEESVKNIVMGMVGDSRRVVTYT